MIAFCCRSCGQPTVVESAAAGGQTACPSCGASTPVPERSEAGVLLLQGEGGDEEVTPVRREEAARGLLAGELKAEQPVWQDGAWVSLSTVLGSPGGGAVGAAAAAPKAENEVELDEVFGPLKPIELVETPPEPEGPPPAPAPPREPRRVSHLLKYVILLAIIAVAGGFVGQRLKLFGKIRWPAGLFAWGSGLTGADVGGAKIKGSTSGGVAALTLTAAGSDIWGKADECHFAYRQANGNLTMVVRVESLTEVHEWSKAGLMVREGLEGGGREVSLVVTPKNGAALQVRDVPGAESRSTVRGAGVFKAPYWLKLERAGNGFRGFVSKDGSRWESLGEYAVTLRPDVLAGLCLTSHDVGKAATATFSAFALTQAAGAAGVKKP